MHKQLWWLIPLALAGCKKPGVEAQNASVAEVAAKVKESGLADTTLKPGQWTATIKLDNIEAPGAPPEMSRQMRQGIGTARTMTECLTEEAAKKPFERFVEGINKECRYDRFAMGGGKIDSKLVCTNAGMERAMTMVGSYTSEAYRMQMDTVAAPKSGVGRVNMTMTLDAKRTGECPAGAK